MDFITSVGPAKMCTKLDNWDSITLYCGWMQTVKQARPFVQDTEGQFMIKGDQARAF